MGTILAGSIVTKASTQLIDTGNTRWTQSELLGWVNDAQRLIVLAQPNTNQVVVAKQLVAGTRQSIPADGWLLLDIYRNMGTNGTTPGNVVRQISRRVLDSFVPGWHSAAPTSAVTNYLFDVQDQTAFYVYPPNDGTGYLEINYSQNPVDMTLTTPIDIFDVMEPVLLNYTLGMAYLKDAEYSGNAAVGQAYMSAFTAALGAKEKAETDNNPTPGLFPRAVDKTGGST